MKILIAHNRYQERGGEDQVVSQEAAMLERHGHAVELLIVDNDAIRGPLQIAYAAMTSFYNLPMARHVAGILQRFRPDLLHVHNFSPGLSPSIFFVAESEHVPVVQTLHNYRLVCANAQLFRDGGICEECLDAKSFLPGIKHACYRGSGVGSAVIGANVALHEALGTWSKRVDRYIALTHFAADKLSGCRVPRDRIRVKPNFVPDTAPGSGEGGYALFAGRLSAEKGLQTILDADQSGRFTLPVHIAGDGPIMPLVRHAAARTGSQLRVLGSLDRAQLQQQMRRASVLLVPSTWYEPFGMVVIEAFAAGLPVVCSAIGGLPELVTDQVTGFLCRPSDPSALAECANRFAVPTREIAIMRKAARRLYEEEFSETTNYNMLLGIYRELVPEERTHVLHVVEEGRYA